MQYRNGDIWQISRDMDAWVVVPTNLTNRRDGKAVMGAGLAKQAAQRFPALATNLGIHLLRFGSRLYLDNYGRAGLHRKIICLPTKDHWQESANMDLIVDGCHELKEIAYALKTVGDERPILLPKIGCGLGGLNWERQVRPVVDSILEGDRFILVSK